MKRALRAVAAGAALVLGGLHPALAGCEAPAGSSMAATDGPVQAWWSSQPAPIVVGEPFALLITLCPADARLLRVDASMPEHRHGMNYRATVEALGPGRWRAEGLLWHMSGHWELRLDVQWRDSEHHLRQSVQLP